ncbi:MAG: HAD family phosphatase [Candidatus Saccharimonadales bacterium]
MSKPFAVFDIDGTLVRWQMFHAIVHHLGKQGYIDPKTHNAIRAARMIWKNRANSESFGHYETLLVHAYLNSLKTIDPAKYDVIVDEVFDEYKDQLFVYTRDLQKKLKKQGYFLLAISGSQDEIIQKLAKYHGFDDAVGAALIKQNGHYTGEIMTPVHDKAKALDELVAKHGLHYKESVGVGDTGGDIPVLAKVERPIAFNPNIELFDAAKANGWDIVVERKNVVYQLQKANDGYQLA